MINRLLVAVMALALGVLSLPLAMGAQEGKAGKVARIGRPIGRRYEVEVVAHRGGSVAG